jgi:hypothetical protein
MTHTPGPWECNGDSISGGVYIPANPKAESHAFEIATIAYSERNYPWIPRGEVRDANARLIESAPDLLAACKEAQNFIDQFHGGTNDGEPLLDLLNAAISKAEGRT